MSPARECKTVCSLVTLVDVDDLTTSGVAAMASCREEVPRAEAIIAEEVECYLGVGGEPHVAPVVAALHDRGEQVRLATLARFQRRLAALDPSQAAAVQALTRGIIAKLLYEPTVNVKSAVGTPAGALLVRGLRQLFQLDTCSPFQSGPAEQRSDVSRQRRFVDPANPGRV
jgi:glutamyl-tRNA reductase